jgi:hypothetical protein
MGTSVKEGVMPSWLTVTLKWGGIAVAIVFAAALIWIELSAPGAKGALSAAPVELYWILLAVGVIAAIIGFTVKKPTT